jgi:Ribonuclease G/E
MWKLTVVEESKTVEGEMRTWYNWAVEKVGLVQDKSLFMEAKAFRESVMKGEAKAQQEEAPVSDSAPAAQMPTDEDIPF